MTLTSGWIRSSLEDCVDILDNHRVPVNSDEREKRIAGKDPSALIPYYGATGLVGWIDDYIFDEEIVLLGEDGAPFLEPTKNKAYIVRGKSWVNNHAHVLRAKFGITINAFIMHYLNAFDFHDYVTGTTRLKLNQSRMREFPIPLPPLPEQERIVRRIESLFTRLDAGVAGLKRAQAGLKRYRASVLKAACEGRLVAQDAEDEPAEGMLRRLGRTASAPTGLADLPQGWCWATLEQLNPPNRKCAYGVLQPGEDKPDGILFIRVGDINEGVIDVQSLKRIDARIAGQYPRTKLNGGEVLITLVGAIGRTAVVPESLAGANTARAVGVIPLVNEICAPWVEIWFRNPERIIEMTSKAHEVARKTLNLEDVRTTKVALPPSDEQRRIVAEVERRLSVVQEVEAAVQANLARAGRLRQAILKRAFEGRLA